MMLKQHFGSAAALSLLLTACSGYDNLAPDTLADDDTILEEGFSRSVSTPIATTRSSESALTEVPRETPPQPTFHSGEATPRTATAPAYRLYTAKKGDSLTLLAARHGITTAALAANNGLSPNAGLRIGQQLRIPAKGSRAAASSMITSRASSAKKPAKTPRNYTVQKGDTLNKIAAKNGVSAEALIRANNINRSTIHLIKIGSILTIPAP